MAHPDSLAAEIEAVEKEIYGKPSGETPAMAVTKKKEVLHVDRSEEPEAPEGTLEGDDTSVTSPAEPAVPTRQADPVTEPEGVATPAQPDPEPPKEDWEKRYKNYKASSDATIHGLRQEVIGLRELVQKQDDSIADLERKIEESTQTPDAGLQFSPEEREVLGDDTIKAIEKANAAAEAKLKPLRDKLRATEEKAREEKKERLKLERKTQHERFLASVKELVPNFETIDRNPQFADWMKGVDKPSGHFREQLFRKAQAAGDVGRVAEFFKQFEMLFMKKRRTEESRVAPTSAPSSQATTRIPQDNQGKPVITQAFIDKFYDDARRGRYRGRLKEQQEIENMIDDHLRALAAAPR